MTPEKADKLGTGGIRLRQHRLARDWLVSDLAEKAGVSNGTISGLENGASWASDAVLERLATALGVTVGELFEVDPRQGKAPGIWTLWRAADEAERQRILDYAMGVTSKDKS